MYDDNTKDLKDGWWSTDLGVPGTYVQTHPTAIKFFLISEFHGVYFKWFQLNVNSQ